MLTLERASQLASIALSHVTREYPHKLDHVLYAPGAIESPRALHPVFYGSYDWHSCVHSWWTLMRTIRLFPALPEAGAVRALADAHFTPAGLAVEAAYIAKHPGFERPYGWAWALMLVGELSRSPAAASWREAAAALEAAIVARWKEFLPKAIYPVRAGTHYNTAFALTLTLDYCAAAKDDALAALCKERARAWYGGDRNAQAWEPSLDDFLSPTLIEALCMRRVLGAGEFRSWFASFLPRLAHAEPPALFLPARPSDRSDGKIAHLDGLNLSRSWCWRGIADALDEALRAHANAAADAHLAASLPHLAEDYMGAHWLASFALLALS